MKNWNLKGWNMVEKIGAGIGAVLLLGIIVFNIQSSIFSASFASTSSSYISVDRGTNQLVFSDSIENLGMPINQEPDEESDEFDEYKSGSFPVEFVDVLEMVIEDAKIRFNTTNPTVEQVGLVLDGLSYAIFDEVFALLPPESGNDDSNQGGNDQGNDGLGSGDSDQGSDDSDSSSQDDNQGRNNGDTSNDTGNQDSYTSNDSSQNTYDYTTPATYQNSDNQTTPNNDSSQSSDESTPSGLIGNLVDWYRNFTGQSNSEDNSTSQTQTPSSSSSYQNTPRFTGESSYERFQRLEQQENNQSTSSNSSSQIDNDTTSGSTFLGEIDFGGILGTDSFRSDTTDEEIADRLLEEQVERDTITKQSKPQGFFSNIFSSISNFFGRLFSSSAEASEADRRLLERVQIRLDSWLDGMEGVDNSDSRIYRFGRYHQVVSAFSQAIYKMENIYRAAMQMMETRGTNCKGSVSVWMTSKQEKMLTGNAEIPGNGPFTYSYKIYDEQGNFIEIDMPGSGGVPDTTTIFGYYGVIVCDCTAWACGPCPGTISHVFGKKPITDPPSFDNWSPEFESTSTCWSLECEEKLQACLARGIGRWENEDDYNDDNTDESATGGSGGGGNSGSGGSGGSGGGGLGNGDGAEEAELLTD